MRYISEIFECNTLEHAKDIVLTPDPNNPNKFEQETKFLVDTIQNQNIINERSVVLDFGCGMGRVSKELINRFNCNVIGTDISIDMMKLATMYVDNTSKFVTCNKVTKRNLVDVCLSSFVLQHVEKPLDEIRDIANILKPNGYLILLNDPRTRFYPGSFRDDNSIVWYDDGIKITVEVEKYFDRIHTIQYIQPDHDVIFYRLK